MDDFSTVRDRPAYTPLSPAEEREFLRRQAEFEAAYHRTSDSLVLWDALRDVWWSRQTVPGWLVMLIGNALIEQRADGVAKRHRERMRTVRRYVCVRDLWKDRTKEAALDLAITFLADEPARAKRGTIERDHDDVRKDLQRHGRESEFFHLVALFDQGMTNYDW
jgi:hypothetical protein